MTPFKRMPYETCWEFMNCPHNMRKECIVYKTDMNEPCWVLNQTGDRRGVLDSCKHFPWFLKNNPDLNQNTAYP
jgi:hypothetical protein